MVINFKEKKEIDQLKRRLAYLQHALINIRDGGIDNPKSYAGMVIELMDEENKK